MIAALLTDGRLTLENVPDLADVGLLKRILANHGVDYMVSGTTGDGRGREPARR
jgi:UDP-N-acetylglucosamine 1-carboxyvinyltransferase